MMRVAASNRFTAVHTVMTGKGLVAAQYFTESKKPFEIIPVLTNIRDRPAKLGLDDPVKIYYTDMCCQEASTLYEVFGSGLTVKLDPFHLLQRFKRSVSSKHAHCGEFLRVCPRPSLSSPRIHWRSFRHH